MRSAKDLRKADVAAQLQISTATLDRWIRNGKAPASYFIGRERRFTQDAIDRWHAKQQAGAR